MNKLFKYGVNIAIALSLLLALTNVYGCLLDKPIQITPLQLMLPYSILGVMCIVLTGVKELKDMKKKKDL